MQHVYVDGMTANVSSSCGVVEVERVGVVVVSL